MNLYQKPHLSPVFLVLLRSGLALIGGACLVLVLAFFNAGEIYDYQDTVARGHLPQVDAIVCLAGGRGRIGLAGDVWLQYRDRERGPGLPPFLYLAGMGPQSHWSQLIKQFRPEVQRAIQQDQVFIEKESSNTVANAVWLADYAAKKHWNRVLLLTSTYHMKRARLIFQKTLQARGNAVEVETLSVFQDPFSSTNWRQEVIGVRVTLMEYLKWLYYRVFWSGEEATADVSLPQS